MSLLHALILGIVQGLTEFLPVSSSAHLLLVPYFMGWQIDAIANIPFYVIVHFGTLVAVVTFFFADVIMLVKALFKSIGERKIGDDPYRRLAWFLILGTVPAGVIYLLLSKLLADALQTPAYVGFFLLITGLILISSERMGKRATNVKEMRTSDVLFIGIAQGIAILPGISRSGSTIAAGLFRGLTREEAARFSFLLSIPIIIAGTIDEAKPILKGGVFSSEFAVLAIGFLAAAVTGYFVIKYFLSYLKNHSLNVFALYCFALGAITLAVTLLK
ncbi:MAG TPA: undecaprenyl-diphosphate phosphatase [Candidatus Aquicultor sp.]|jgi:undecaprenyl-diphosphatase